MLQIAFELQVPDTDFQNTKLLKEFCVEISLNDVIGLFSPRSFWHKRNLFLKESAADYA